MAGGGAKKNEKGDNCEKSYTRSASQTQIDQDNSSNPDLARQICDISLESILLITNKLIDELYLTLTANQERRLTKLRAEHVGDH